MRFLHKFKKYIFSPIKISFIAALVLHIILLTNLSGEVLLCKSNIIEDEIIFKMLNKEDKYLNEPPKPQVKEKRENKKDKKELDKTFPAKIKKFEKIKKKKADINIAANQKKEVKKPSRKKQVTIIKKPEDMLQDKQKKKNEQKAKTNIADKQKIGNNNQVKKEEKKVESYNSLVEKENDKVEKLTIKNSNKKEQEQQIVPVKEIQDRKYAEGENEIKQKKEQFNPLVRQMQAKNNYMQLQKTITTQKDRVNNVNNNQSKQIKPDNKKVENQGDLNISTDFKSKYTGFKNGFREEEPEFKGENNDDKKTNNQINSNVPEAEIIDFTQGQYIEGVIPPGVNEINQPVYPQDLREREIEGRVILELLVNEKGEVNKAKIYKASGFEQFDRAAKEAAVNWLFTSAEKDGHKVMARLLVPIKFKLD